MGIRQPDSIFDFRLSTASWWSKGCVQHLQRTRGLTVQPFSCRSRHFLRDAPKSLFFTFWSQVLGSIHILDSLVLGFQECPSFTGVQHSDRCWPHSLEAQVQQVSHTKITGIKRILLVKIVGDAGDTVSLSLWLGLASRLHTSHIMLVSQLV